MDDRHLFTVILEVDLVLYYFEHIQHERSDFCHPYEVSVFTSFGIFWCCNKRIYPDDGENLSVCNAAPQTGH